MPNTEHRPTTEPRIPNTEYRTPRTEQRIPAPAGRRALRLAATRYGIPDSIPNDERQAANNEAEEPVASPLPRKEVVSTVSTRLRRARERRGLRIEDISA